MPADCKGSRSSTNERALSEQTGRNHGFSSQSVESHLWPAGFRPVDSMRGSIETRPAHSQMSPLQYLQGSRRAPIAETKAAQPGSIAEGACRAVLSGEEPRSFPQPGLGGRRSTRESHIGRRWTLHKRAPGLQRPAVDVAPEANAFRDAVGAGGFNRS